MEYQGNTSSDEDISSPKVDKGRTVNFSVSLANMIKRKTKSAASYTKTYSDSDDDNKENHNNNNIDDKFIDNHHRPNTKLKNYDSSSSTNDTSQSLANFRLVISSSITVLIIFS